MGIKQTSKYCDHCKKNVLATGTKPNHLLHLVLTILTLGVWIVVWILIVIGKLGGYRCNECGNRVSHLRSKERVVTPKRDLRKYIIYGLTGLFTLAFIGAFIDDKKAPEYMKENTTLSTDNSKPSDCYDSWFISGKTIDIGDGTLAHEERYIAGGVELKSVVNSLMRNVWLITQGCADATKLIYSVRLTGFIDRYGNDADDLVKSITIELDEVRKFKKSYSWETDEIYWDTYGAILKSSSLGRHLE